MVFSFAKKKGPTLGLDINSDSISILQIEQTKLGTELTRFSKQPTPPNAVREGLITDPDTVGAIVRELLDELGLSASGPTPTVNVVVPGQSVVVRLMPVPIGMPAEELADVVTQEAINHVPFPINEANLDWSLMQPTERTDPDGVQRVDVILAAVQKGIVDAYWRMADAAGVRIGKLDMSALALLRGLSFAGYLPAEPSLILTVNVRHDATDINLVRSGMPLFTRSVLLGLETLGEALSRSLEISLVEAMGLLPQIPLFGMAPPDPKVGQAAQIARTVFGDIIDEIGRSLEFYRSQVGEVQIDKLLMCGPGCRIPQVDQFVSSRLNLNVEIANPFREINADEALMPLDRRADFTMALGALTEQTAVAVPTVELDLNKDGPSAGVLEGAEERETVKVFDVETPWFAPVLGAGAAVLILTAGVWAYLSQYDVPKKQAELSTLTTMINQEKKQLDTLSKLKAENAVLAQKKVILSGIVNHGQQFASILQVVKDNTPEGVQISKVEVDSSSINLTGKAVDFASISDLSLNLNSSGIITNPTLDYAKRSMSTDPRVIDFDISATVVPGGPRQLASNAVVAPKTDATPASGAVTAVEHPVK